METAPVAEPDSGDTTQSPAEFVVGDSDEGEGDEGEESEDLEEG